MTNSFFPNGCGVLIETMDGTLDLSDISWQEVAPCGCICGVAMAATPNDLLVTAEQAGRHCSEAEYARDVDRGFTWRPRAHRSAVDELATDCTHEPKWGVAVTPVPEGHQWAAVHCLGSRTRIKHLVTTAAVQRVENREYGAGDTKPLCGGKAAFWWKSDWFALDGKAECTRCVTAAKKAAS